MNLNNKFIEEINKNHKKDADDKIVKYTNKFLKQVTDNLENFSYNKIVANLHEMYSFMFKNISKGYKKDTLVENYKKILITMQPIIPHFSNECLELLNADNFKWPKFDENILKEENINLVIQINGKKRGLVKIKIDSNEEELMKIIQKEEKIKKYIQKNEIKKKIYVKNKLLNIII